MLASSFVTTSQKLHQIETEKYQTENTSENYHAPETILKRNEFKPFWKSIQYPQLPFEILLGQHSPLDYTSNVKYHFQLFLQTS